MREFAGTRYEARMRELLDDEECTIVGDQLIYAPIAGAHDVIRLYFASAAATHELPRARILIAEVPDDEPWHEMTAALLANGFREEGRINDFVTDGIALRLIVRRSS